MRNQKEQETKQISCNCDKGIKQQSKTDDKCDFSKEDQSMTDQKVQFNLDMQKSSSDIKQIEEQIMERQLGIHHHRIQQKQEQGCWYFGLDCLPFDYGQIWSSTQYWHALINSNFRNCTIDMHFKKNLECCDNCHNVLITLQALKQKWDQCINIKLSDKQQEQTQQAEQQVKLRKQQNQQTEGKK